MDLGGTLLVMCLVFVGVLGIIVLAIIAGLAVRILYGGKRQRGANDDEARLMQEIYLGLERLNDRVGSIETIVLDEREETNTV